MSVKQDRRACKLGSVYLCSQKLKKCQLKILSNEELDLNDFRKYHLQNIFLFSIKTVIAQMENIPLCYFQFHVLYCAVCVIFM